MQAARRQSEQGDGRTQRQVTGAASCSALWRAVAYAFLSSLLPAASSGVGSLLCGSLLCVALLLQALRALLLLSCVALSSELLLVYSQPYVLFCALSCFVLACMSMLCLLPDARHSSFMCPDAQSGQAGPASCHTVKCGVGRRTHANANSNSTKASPARGWVLRTGVMVRLWGCACYL